MRMPSLVLTILALLCFALPFFVVSCQGQPVDTITGLNLVTGRDVPGALAGAPPHHLPSNMWAIAAFALGIVGAILLAVNLGDSERAAALAAVIVCAAAICLLLIRFAARDALGHQFIVDIKVGYGYYLATLFMIAAAVVSAMSAVGPRPRAPAPPG
jgi:hypothetical protein